MVLNTETSLVFKWMSMYSLLSLEYTTWLLPWFSTDLQSGEVDASCQRSKPIYRFELAESIENRYIFAKQIVQVVY